MIIARAYAAALISVVQSVTDATGRAVIDASPAQEAAIRMRSDAALALDHLDQTFRATLKLAEQDGNTEWDETPLASVPSRAYDGVLRQLPDTR